jgi:hypothetical protein
MPSASDTAYPRLKFNPSTKELNELYSPTVYGLAFARERARQPGKEEAIFAARDQKLLQARETRKTKRNQNNTHSLAATLTFSN